MRSSQGYDPSTVPGFRNGVDSPSSGIPPSAHRQRPRTPRQQSFPPPKKASTSIRPQKPEAGSPSGKGTSSTERRSKIQRQKSQEKVSSSKQNPTREAKKERRTQQPESKTSQRQSRPLRRSKSQTKLGQSQPQQKEDPPQIKRRSLRRSKSQTKLGQTQPQQKEESTSTQQHSRSIRRSKSQTKLGQPQPQQKEESTLIQQLIRPLRRSKSQTKLVKPAPQEQEPEQKTSSIQQLIRPLRRSKSQTKLLKPAPQEQEPEQKTRRPKLSKTKSGESLPPKTRQKPKQSRSQPSLAEGLSDELPAEPPKSTEKSRKIKGKIKSSKQQRQGKQQEHVEKQKVRPRPDEKVRPKSSSDGAAAGPVGIQLLITLDSPPGHGEKFTIVPGIEISDEEEDEMDDAIKSEQKPQEWSLRSDRTPAPFSREKSKRAPLTPGALMSPESRVSRSQNMEASENFKEQHAVPNQSESGRSRSFSGNGSMGDLTARILQELDGESMAGAASMSSQQQNWDWLQSTLEQHEAEVLRQKQSPPRAPTRQRSSDGNEAIEPMNVGTPRKGRKLNATQGDRNVRSQEKPQRGTTRQKHDVEARAPSLAAFSSVQKPEKESRTSARSLSQKLSRHGPQSAVQPGSDLSASVMTNRTMDDTIAGSECLPESDLAEQVWMESNNDDSDYSEEDLLGEAGSFDHDEDAYVRQYVERMQQQTRSQLPHKESQSPPNSDRGSRSTSSNAQLRAVRDDDDDESIDLPDAYLASKSDRLSQMVAAMKRKDTTPSTPVVARNSILEDQAGMEDYGVTPRATNITAGIAAPYGVTPKAANISGIKAPQNLNTMQMIEDLQESFTDLHIGIGSCGDSIANSSLSLSITSEDHRRRFLASTNSQEGSIRSSFNQSLTSITEGLELTGEQLEMLELGSKVQMRSRKKMAKAAAVSSQNGSDHSRGGQESLLGIASDVASELTTENPSLSPTQMDDPPRLPTRNISAVLDKMKGPGLLVDDDEAQNGHGVSYGAQARLQAALGLAQKYKATSANGAKAATTLETVYAPPSRDPRNPSISSPSLDQRNGIPHDVTAFDDDIMPELADMEQMDAQNEYLYDGKRRSPRTDNGKQLTDYDSDDDGASNVTGMLFSSKKTESVHEPRKYRQSKNSHDGSGDTDSRSTTSHSVADRLFHLGISNHLYDGADMDESEASVTSHHSL